MIPESSSMMEPGIPFTHEDARWMRRALRLAGHGFTPPNPRVGCVLVKDGVVVGEGFHPVAGAPHAEIFALRSAGERARGATAFVTLEPCSHFGRTPPCSNALIAAGVRRVVVAVQDPNPTVAGSGLAKLREAGVEIQAGLLEQEARDANAPFFHYQHTGIPYVALKAAMTLDGKIATRTGDSKWITGERARSYGHKMRAQYSAVLCGIGTVLADDPLLTARFPGVPRQPVRIVLDTHLRTPEASKLVQTAREAPTLLVAGVAHDVGRAKILHSYGVEILSLETDTYGHIPLRLLLDELAKREIISVLVEGGGVTHAAFLDQRLVQRIFWFVAPKLAGGKDAPTPFEGTGVGRMSEAIKLEEMRFRRFADDLLIEATPRF